MPSSSELVTPRERVPHPPTTPRSPMTGSPAPRHRHRRGNLLASIVSPSTMAAPRNAISNGANILVRGLRNRFFFSALTMSPGAEPEVTQIPPTPRAAATALWSPGRADAGGRAERMQAQPLERNVRGLFSNAAPGTPQKVCEECDDNTPVVPISPIPVCCICLDDMDTVKASNRLRCPQCTMQAHARCLSHWFQSEAASANRRLPQNSQGSPLPKTTATCPNCRSELDWDALALQARRGTMPLNMALASGNDAFRPKPESAALAQPGQVAVAPATTASSSMRPTDARTTVVFRRTTPRTVGMRSSIVGNASIDTTPNFHALVGA